jgi:hypothetical protein
MLVEKLEVVASAAKALNWSDKKILRELKAILPNKDEPEQEVKAIEAGLATDLLKMFGAPMATAEFNKRMLALGLLKHGQLKHQKVLTEEGTAFGYNRFKGNKGQSRPEYYVNTFKDLLDLVKD